VSDYANVLVKVVAILGGITVYLQLHLHITFFVTPQLHISYLPRKMWLLGLNRASKINVGLKPGLGFKERPFYNSVWVCMQGATRRD